MFLRCIQILLSGLVVCLGFPLIAPAQPIAYDITDAQNDFMKLRFGMFLHFNMATFVDLEWANGYEDPALFQPRELDCRQWAQAAESAGMKYAVLTVKHTGAWCLWDSKYTTHDITAFKNYKNGNGDIVREFVDAFRARGMKVGFYYCFPGDFSRPPWGHTVPKDQIDLHALPPEAVGDFAGFIMKQLTELLTNYGPIDLLWIDQYKNKYTYAYWPEIRDYIKSLQPQCLVIANNAHDLAESDVLSYELPWDPNSLPPEDNTSPSEVCDKISRGWFWSTLEKPEDIGSASLFVERLKLFNSRNSNYLLDVPPDNIGLITQSHLECLKKIGELRRSEGGGAEKK